MQIGPLRPPAAAVVGETSGVEVRNLVQPAADGQNGVVVKVPDANWGTETGHSYGTAQALLVLKEDTDGAVEPTDLVMWRVNGKGDQGLCGGLHIATGLRQRPGYTANYAVHIDRTTDCIGIIVDAANDSPAAAYQQWRLNDGTVIAEIDSAGKLKANRTLDALTGDAATTGAFRVGRTAVEGGISVQGSGTALLASAAAGDVILHNYGATRRVIIGSGVAGNTAAIIAGNNTLGFHGTAPIAKAAVSGSRGGNAALAALLTALANKGLITDSTTA